MHTNLCVIKLSTCISDAPQKAQLHHGIRARNNCTAFLQLFIFAAFKLLHLRGMGVRDTNSVNGSIAFALEIRFLEVGVWVRQVQLYVTF